LEQKGGGSWTKTVGILAAGAAVSLVVLTFDGSEKFLEQWLIAMFPFGATLAVAWFLSKFAENAKTAGAITGAVLFPFSFLLGSAVARNCPPVAAFVSGSIALLGGIVFVVSLTVCTISSASRRRYSENEVASNLPAAKAVPESVPLWRSRTAAILLICVLISIGLSFRSYVNAMVENFETALFFAIFPYVLIFGLTLVASLLTDAARPAGSASGIFFFVMTFGLNAFLLSFLLQKFGAENTILPFLFRLLFNPLLTSITIYLICLLFAVMIGRHHRKHLAPPAHNEPLG